MYDYVTFKYCINKCKLMWILDTCDCPSLYFTVFKRTFVHNLGVCFACIIFGCFVTWWFWLVSNCGSGISPIARYVIFMGFPTKCHFFGVEALFWKTTKTRAPNFGTASRRDKNFDRPKNFPGRTSEQIPSLDECEELIVTFEGGIPVNR